MEKPQYPLRKRFDTFNRQYFGGEIPAVKLAFDEFLGASGKCSCKLFPLEESQRSANQPRRHVPGSIKILLNNSLELTESEFDDVLLHEMIHAWLTSKDKLRPVHGRLFRKKRQALEEVRGQPIGKCDSEPAAPKVPDSLVALCWFDEGELRACAFARSSCVLRARRRFRDEWAWVTNERAELRAYDITDPQVARLATGHKVHKPTGLVTRRGKPTIQFSAADDELAKIPTMGEPIFRIRRENSEL